MTVIHTNCDFFVKNIVINSLWNNNQQNPARLFFGLIQEKKPAHFNGHLFHTSLFAWNYYVSIRSKEKPIITTVGQIYMLGTITKLTQSILTITRTDKFIIIISVRSWENYWQNKFHEGRVPIINLLESCTSK